jgi:hypothetical protein
VVFVVRVKNNVAAFDGFFDLSVTVDSHIFIYCSINRRD